MEFWIKAAQLIASLSILVVLHELGHFIPAKLFKTRVEKFYLFFDPGFSLLKFKKGDTEYGIGWLPLGGYVKISGMVDESMDKEQLEKPAEPWEFRSKPAWQRLIIMVGGVTVNLILAIIIYAGTLFVWGEELLPNESLSDGVWCVNPLAEEIGFQNGDKILSIRGEEPKYFGDFVPMLIFSGEVQVERNGEKKVVNVPEDVIDKLSNSRTKGLFYPRVPFIIGAIPDTSLNANAGIQKKDKILAIDGQSVEYFDEAKDIFAQKAGQKVTVELEREGEKMDLPLTVSDSGLIEVSSLIMSFDEMEKSGLYQFEQRRYSFFESIPAGVKKAWKKLSDYVEQFKLIFNPKTGAYKSLGGFGTIGGLFPSTWEWQSFWEITAILSIILAFMNILPIPALDGGHVMFLLYEIVTGRPPNQKFLEKAQIVGMILLLALLVYANGNDIFRWITGK